MLNIKKFKPMYTGIITTMNTYEDDVYTKGILRIKKGSIKEYQTVIEIGGAVRDINIGDVVLIDPKRYAKLQHQEGSFKDGMIKDNPVLGYEFSLIELDGVTCMHIQEGDIRGVIVESEEIPDSNIIIQEPKIILD